MIRRATALLPAILLASTTAAIAAPQEMKPGKWQITMTSEEAGQKPSSFNMTQCMGAEELKAQVASPGAGAPGKEGDFEMNSESDGCKYHMSQKGNVSHITSDCEGQQTTTTITHETESFKMETTMTGEGAGKSIMEGKRLGDC